MKTAYFEPIHLEQMDRVKLMNRIDQKFWFHEEQLQQILQAVSDDYYILDIDGITDFPYSSTYYDTRVDRMYTNHHNGKRNRYKVRRRSYLSTGISFLEIKFKSNKGRTFKQRIKGEYGENSFSPEECEFISANTPFTCEDLEASLINKFIRITLVNRNFRERCTIDRKLQYTKNGAWQELKHLAIIEIKTDGRQSVSPLALALKEERIRASGFSKYCIGRVLTDRDVKRNNFKKKTRMIEKALHTNKDLFNNKKQ